MGSNTEKKKPWINVQNLYKKWSKEVKSDNYIGNNGKRSNIANVKIDSVPEIILHFEGTNNILVWTVVRSLKLRFCGGYQLNKDGIGC